MRITDYHLLSRGHVNKKIDFGKIIPEVAQSHFTLLKCYVNEIFCQCGVRGNLPPAVRLEPAFCRL